MTAGKGKAVLERLAALSPAKQALLRRRAAAGTLDGHSAIAQALLRLGVTHLFALPGVPVYRTAGACCTAGLTVVGMRGQSAAVMAAAAMNYLAGRLVAAALVSPGPGSTNAATGLLVARDNAWPVLLLAGGTPLATGGMGDFQEGDCRAWLEPLTKWARRSERAEDIPALIAAAAQVTLCGRPGPAFLELPCEVLNGRVTEAAVTSLAPPTRMVPEPDDGVIGGAAAILAAAERPLLVIGKGARWSAPWTALRRLVDHHGMAFLTAPMARGFLPDDHPACCNDIGCLAQGEADAVLVVGARLNWTFRFGHGLAPSAKVIQVDVAADEFQRGRGVDVGILSDAGPALTALDSRLAGLPAPPARRHWRHRLEQARTARQSRGKAVGSGLPTPRSIARLLASHLPAETIVVLDGALIMAAVEQDLPALTPLTRLTAGSNGCMGVGLPFAMAAKLLWPDRPVVVVSGDTALGFDAMELETAARYGLAVAVVVANNQGNITGRDQLGVSGPESGRIVLSQPGLRYDMLAVALGGTGRLVKREQDLVEALEAISMATRPMLINVMTATDTGHPDHGAETE